MNAKTDAGGRPQIIFLQDWFDARSVWERARVILPITDPYVVHHGSLGSFATCYLPAGADVADICARLRRRFGHRDSALARGGCGPLRVAARPSRRHRDHLGALHVLGTTPARHDLSGLDAPLRSHGGISEQRVPLLFNRVLRDVDPGRRLRNFDVFDLALNHLN